MLLTVTLNTSIDKLYQIDALTPYEVMRVDGLCNTAGGKGMNVSRIAAQLGEPVTAVGFTGGFTGQYFESLITQQNICKAFTRVEAETRCCINIWDMDKKRSTECLEPGAAVTQEDVLRFYKEFEAALKKADAVTISGSVPKGVPVECYARLIEMCHTAEKAVLLDTSGEMLRLAVQAKPDFIKPNIDEIEQLLGYRPQTEEALVEAAQALRKNGVGTVVVSLGAQGALMVCGDGVFSGVPPCIVPKNTVGCGDSMVAGFAVGRMRGMTAEEQLRLAVAVSAANALSMGTGGYEEADFAAILPQVVISQLQK